jgi:Transposase IS4
VATNADEVWLFIKVNLFMGFIDLPELHMYWEERWRQVQVTRAFTRHRFEELQRWWHIGPPPAADVEETLIDKIRPLWEHCQQAFRAFCNPPREMTVDETMVRFKGKSKDKTTIRGKPTPVGYKLYTVASHGYLLAFDLSISTDRRPTEQGVLHSAVVRLVQPWFNTDRIVFFDNLYTSPALCDYLKREGLYSCGTCRTNRVGLPPTAKHDMEQLDKGEMKAWRRGDLQCLAWHDSKPILFLSTHHKVDKVVTLEGKRGPRPRPGVTKPQIVHEYNQHKCHVDTVDQLRQSYAIQRRHRKTWPSLAWWLVDMCIINDPAVCMNAR